MKKLMKQIFRWLFGRRPSRERVRTKVYNDATMLEGLQGFLFSRHRFRFNVLTEQTEWESLATNGWVTVDKRLLNSFTLEAKAAGIDCWDRDIARLLLSNQVPEFHPMKAYMESLPRWDMRDRIRPLAWRIARGRLWEDGFHRWLLGVASQWMGQGRQCANAVAPILISAEQGVGKSTFCRLLVPESLRAYYIDRFDVNRQSHFEQRLATTALINLDEFDRYSPATMASLKNVMQMQSGNFRKMRSERFVSLHRTASFIGTSNQRELLTDLTGSRRFLCQEVEGKIDCSPIEHKQLFAQLKYELRYGERSWLSKEEEQLWRKHNAVYYRTLPEQEAFLQCFRLPKDGEVGQEMSSLQVLDVLQRRFPKVMRGIQPKQLSRAMLALGVQRRHTKMGNVFWVVKLG